MKAHVPSKLNGDHGLSQQKQVDKAGKHINYARAVDKGPTKKDNIQKSEMEVLTSENGKLLDGNNNIKASNSQRSVVQRQANINKPFTKQRDRSVPSIQREKSRNSRKQQQWQQQKQQQIVQHGNATQRQDNASHSGQSSPSYVRGEAIYKSNSPLMHDARKSEVENQDQNYGSRPHPIRKMVDFPQAMPIQQGYNMPVFPQIWPAGYDPSEMPQYGYGMPSNQFVQNQQPYYYMPDVNGQQSNAGTFDKANKKLVETDVEQELKKSESKNEIKPQNDVAKLSNENVNVVPSVINETAKISNASADLEIRPLSPRKREKKIIAIVNPETNEEIQLPPKIEDAKEKSAMKVDVHNVVSSAEKKHIEAETSDSTTEEEKFRRQEQLRNEIQRLRLEVLRKEALEKGETLVDLKGSDDVKKSSDEPLKVEIDHEECLPEKQVLPDNNEVLDNKSISTAGKDDFSEKQVLSEKEEILEEKQDLPEKQDFLEKEILSEKESPSKDESLQNITEDSIKESKDVVVDQLASSPASSLVDISIDDVSSAKCSRIENKELNPKETDHSDVEIGKRGLDGVLRYSKENLYVLSWYSRLPNSNWEKKVKDTIVASEETYFARPQNKSDSKFTSKYSGSSQDFSFGNFSAKPSATRGFGDKHSHTQPHKNFTGGMGSFRSSGQSIRNTSNAGKESRKSSNRKGKNDSRKDTESMAEDLKFLEVSETGWKPHNMFQSAPKSTESDDLLSPESVQRKIKAALNKLTIEKFDKISDQILEIAIQSKQESDGRTLRQVIQLTFEKATDEPNFANMYARFCRKMMEKIDESIKDDNILDKNNEPVKGGMLFRKYLLNRCQENFERGWKVDCPKDEEKKEAEMLSDEYYVLAAAKRRGLGLVRFIGELYNLGMLSKRIMLECLQRLLANVKDPEEEEVESLCKLLPTIGKSLDEDERTRPSMMVYFQRMEEMRQAPSLPARFKFMIHDVIDLRNRHWVSSDAEKGPKTIQEIHDDAERQAHINSVTSQRLLSKSHSARSNNDHYNRDAHSQKQSIANEGWSKHDARFGQLRIKPTNAQGSSNLMQMMRSHSRGLVSSGGQSLSKDNSRGSGSHQSINKFDILTGEKEGADHESLDFNATDTKAGSKN